MFVRCKYSASARVALRKESVDRNTVNLCNLGASAVVALRKESVDRNDELTRRRTSNRESLSARRAWIEIYWEQSMSIRPTSRSPQGERG